jgi:hypothetical protein
MKFMAPSHISAAADMQFWEKGVTSLGAELTAAFYGRDDPHSGG